MSGRWAHARRIISSTPGSCIGRLERLRIGERERLGLRQTDQPCKRYFLFRQIVEQRVEPLLLGLQLDQAAIDVDAGVQAAFIAIDRLRPEPPQRWRSVLVRYRRGFGSQLPADKRR